MKTLIHTANFGRFDKPQNHANQSADYWCATEKELPARMKAMTPRLQARIVKTHAWQLKPGYDFYLWVDSSTNLVRTDSLRWFIEQLGDKDMAVFRHNRRKTIQEEADYLKHRLKINCPYITPRYEGEDIDGQMAEVDPSGQLFASTVFIYRPTTEVKEALKAWWVAIARFHSIDQLSLTEAIKGVSQNVIDEDYLKCKYLEHNR